MAGRIPLKEQEVEALYAVLDRFSLRNQCLIILGLNSGYRITELLSLQVGQVWNGRQVLASVTVDRARLKFGRSARRRSITSRSVPLNDLARDYIERYMQERSQAGPVPSDAPLFASRELGGKLSRWQANRIIHEVFDAANIGDRARRGTHSLRKTFAQSIYKATGHDINLTRAVLSHRSILTTQAYLTIDQADATAAVMALGKMRPVTVEITQEVQPISAS